MASILGVETLQHTNGTTAATIDSSGNVTFEKPTFSVALLADEQPNNTVGGTFTSGSWVTRTLNTEVSDTDGIVSLSSNVFTLGAGTYVIEWSAPAYKVGNHQSRLYDNTNSNVVDYGTAEFTSSSDNTQTRSFGEAKVTISASTSYKIEHRCYTTSNTYGLGANASFGNVEVYTQVKITKLA